MRPSFLFSTLFVSLTLLLPGCASRPRDFIPNGAAANLEPTNPDHIRVFDSIPRGMVIGTVLVDRSKAHDTGEIIEMARIKAAAVGGDFIVWEDSLGTVPSAESGSPTPPPSAPDPGTLGHSTAAVPSPELTPEKTPKARFTVGIFLPDARHSTTQ